MRYSQVTDWCHEMIRSHGRAEGFYIDATMGGGRDTLFLSKLAGERGRVLAFDIQPEALDATRELLHRSGIAGAKEERIRLILDGHEHMDRYAKDHTADVICFNFGYFPGGDHRIATRAETSTDAVEKGLRILKPGGMMSLCIYSGGDTGFEEKEALLTYMRTLPAKEYTVIVNEYYNRANHPPMPVFIFKN